MKRRISKRILAGILTFGMAASLMPATAFAAQEVDAKPGSGTLPVEYFSSTLYNWDESAANAATAEADRSSGTVYTETSVRYKDVASRDSSAYQSTNYWYRGNDGEYYPVYYTRDSWWWTTYTLYYRSGNSYEEFGSTTDGNDRITLYTRRQGGYEGKGLYFTAANNKQNSPNFSNWDESKDSDNVVKQNYYIYSGLAAKHLDESANIPFSDAVNAAPLFATDGSNDSYTKVYENVQVPFVYDEETGYYTLDSDSNAVYFDGSPQDNAKMAIADQPAAHSNTVGDYHYTTGFLPFNSLDSDNEENARLSISDKGKSSYVVNGDVDWGFGMVTSVNFQMTDNGLDANGEPITFEFSGDDDVWVYVDDTLVLDIGGTHDAVLGTIDFSTGKVELTAPAYGEETSDGGKTGKIGDMATDPSMSNPTEGTISQTNIYEVLDAESLIDFASQGEHTLKIYYMERGRGRSNCLIKFNLPQRDTVSVTKEITKSKTPNGQIDDLTDEEQALVDGLDFGFTLYKDNEPVASTSYYITKPGESRRSGTTDANGHFTLQNGETATFLGAIEGGTYYVVEDEPDNSGTTTAYVVPDYTYSSNASNTEVVGQASEYQSMKIKADGSETANDSISFVCENYMNAQLPNPSILPAEDLIVIDYGLPISISSERLISNDPRRGEEFEITAVTGGTYGTAVLSEDHSTITYTLEKQLNGIEELTYTAIATSGGGEFVSEAGQGTIKIIPATSMYYEENFGSTVGDDGSLSGGMIEYSNQTVKWVQEGTAIGGNQETGYVGDDSDSTYGTDAIYLNDSGDSYGTSRYANADGAAGAAFEYDFTGTGTAIYGRTSSETGYIEVVVTNKDTGEEADRQYINTRIVDNISGKEELYNIPIYNSTDEFAHGNYHVRVYLYKKGTPVNGYYEDEIFVEGSDKSGAGFYLDGIRVYDPVKGNETAEGAYATDGEANVSVINIREKLVADDTEGYGNDIFTLTDKYGDEFADGDIGDLETYIKMGPNEELYLNGDGYTVTFSLVNWDSQRFDLYLGMKSPDGSSATVTIGNKEFTVNNSTDCYYDISDQIVVDSDLGYPVGTVTISGVSGLVSLTNIKVTGDYEFNLGYASDLETNGLDEQTLYLVPSNYFQEDEEPEEGTEVFVPENIRTTCSYGSKTMKATITVLTSQDVSKVEINGTAVDPKTVNGKYKFTYSEKQVAAGTVYNIVAYDANGVASETYTVTAE